jgi:PAS domain S-box-containing protein
MLPEFKEDISTRATLELLYHISRELSSALEMRTVLERVLFLSMQNVGAISGSIIVLDDNGKPVDSAIITGDMVHNHTTQRLRDTLDRGLAGWVVRERRAALVEDTSRDKRWMPRQYEDVEQQAPKSAVSAPLLIRDKLVGVLTLIHPKPGFFTSDHVALAQAIADQAGIAVLNGRLYAESQRQARVMTALATSASGISVSLNLEDVLTGIVEQTDLALNVQVVMLSLIDSANGKLTLRADKSWTNSKAPQVPHNIERGIAWWVTEHDEGVIIHDVTKDERFDVETDQRSRIKSKAIICAPIRYRGQVIGALEAINPKEGDFDADALLVLTGIASLAGTAIRHAQLYEQLQAAHQSYRELFEDSIDPILITNWDGEILEANRKGVLTSDYSKKDLCKMRIDQIHTVDQELVGEGFSNIHSGKTFFYESRLRTRGGHEVPIEVYVHQIQADSISRLQWILRDITERKKLDTLREDLISMIFHDMRSPLANVVSSLDVLDTMLPLTEEPAMKSLLDIAMRSTERIQRLTDSLLDMNRLEAGQLIGNRQVIDISVLVKEAADVISPIAKNKNQKLTCDISANLPNVLVDPDMIRRVITNLIENAAKYSPSGGHIQINAHREDNQVCVWVQDNGPGIPASEYERIFDKFIRLSSDEAPRGLGLGLAYCRLAILGHGGKIWVESEVGVGSRFIFTLPISGT